MKWEGIFFIAALLGFVAGILALTSDDIGFRILLLSVFFCTLIVVSSGVIIRKIEIISKRIDLIFEDRLKKYCSDKEEGTTEKPKKQE